MNRTDIYRRLKYITAAHTNANKNREAHCFAVGREYTINVDNLLKGDIQNGNPSELQYFYSRKWSAMGKPAHAPTVDYPMVFMTPGEVSLPSRDRMVMAFDLLVFDLINYTPDNFSGNASALRPLEVIWEDCEVILRNIVEAYDYWNISTFNDAIAAEELGLSSIYRSVWSPAELAQVADWYSNLSPGTAAYEGDIMPFDYDYNNRAAGVAARIRITTYDDCPAGEFGEINC